MGSPPRRATNLIALLGHWIVASAEIFEFAAHEVPASYSVTGWRLFHVYNKQDYAKMSGLTKLAEVESPIVELHLRFSTLLLPAPKHHAFEAALIYHQDFMEHFDQEHFCKKGHLMPMTGISDIEWALVKIQHAGEDVPKQRVEKVHVPLNKSGDYLLLLSNCGDFKKAHVFGSVRVRNPYGYLPPEHYHSEGPLRVVLAAYCLLGTTWLVHSLRKREQVYDVQLYLLGLLMWSIAEVAAKLWTLNAWNTTGENEPWMTIATVLHVLKWIYLYFLALHVAGGWFDRDGVNDCIGGPWLSVLTICSVYVVFLSMHQSVMNQHEGLGLQTSTVLLFRAPVILMDAALLVYLVLRTRQEYEKSLAAVNIDRSRTFGELKSLALSCACLSGVAFVFDLAHSLGLYSLSWRSQWLQAEGAAHGISLLALGSVMFHMRPGLVQQKNVYGKVAAGGVDTEPPATLGRAEEMDDED